MSFCEDVILVPCQHANVTKNRSSDCVITGLPYSVTTTNATPTGWTTNNTERIGVAGDYMCMKKNDAYAISPRFYVPDNLGVSIGINAYTYKGWSSYSAKVYFSASTTGNMGGVSSSITGSDAYPVSATFKDYSGNATFTQSVSQACIYAKGSGSTIGTGFTASVIVKSISIKYSE